MSHNKLHITVVVELLCDVVCLVGSGGSSFLTAVVSEAITLAVRLMYCPREHQLRDLL